MISKQQRIFKGCSEITSDVTMSVVIKLIHSEQITMLIEQKDEVGTKSIYAGICLAIQFVKEHVNAANG
jgi:phage terminase large subunit